MKNRRTVLISFLLIACLCIGIGYAYVTGTVTVEGEATTAVSPLNVVFSAAALDTADAGASASALAISKVGTPGDKTISFTAAGLTYVNEYVSADFTIRNDSQYPVVVSAPVVSTTNYFDVTVSEWADEAGNNPAEGTITLAVGATESFSVKVQLTEGSADKLSETFTITFNTSAGTPTAVVENN